MTNQEAINELQLAIDLIKQDGKDWLDERDIPILEMAIKALEAQDVSDTNVGGMISRQAAIDALRNINAIVSPISDDVLLIDKAEAMTELMMLPPARPEQHRRVFKGIVVGYPSYNIYPEYKGKPYFSIKYTENGQEFIGYGTYKPEVLSEYLKEYFIPSAEPERKKGKWVKVSGYSTPGGDPTWCCSECGKGIHVYGVEHVTYGKDIADHQWVACPNCGAKMGGEQ